jgi:putative DNA primase/helicase
MVIDARTLARALGGDVVGRNMVVAPGPGHSRRDRSLSVRLTDDDFVVFSHAGDDWQTCKDYVRERLGWPAWRPGDGQDRRVALARVESFDRAVVDAESERREPTQEDLARIECARAIWDEAADPRGTEAERYLGSRELLLEEDVAGSVLRSHLRCPWRDEDIGTTIYVPALVAAFRSIDDDAVTAIHRIRVDQPERWPKTERRMLGVVHHAAVKLGPLGDSSTSARAWKRAWRRANSATPRRGRSVASVRSRSSR